ncbi:MAG: alpha/beta fold hydrolase [Elusimicrobiales bacterium]|nr:alpha/beta fold hydrolase [Elusimicrobiales bacterium]
MKNLFTKIIIKFLLYFTIITFVLSSFIFFLYSKPKRLKEQTNPSEFNLKWQKVSISSKNHILKGWLIENKKEKLAIILMHGWPADKSDILPFTYFLHEFATLLYIDIRGLGESQGYVCGSKYEIEDIKKWINFLNEKGFLDIALFGYSYGAFLALRAASEIENLKFVISDSPFISIKSTMLNILKNYHIMKYPIIYFMGIKYKIFCGEKIDKFNINKSIQDIKSPTLFICGTKDNLCYNSKTRDYSKINPLLKVELMEELTHGETLINKKYKKIVNEFIRSNK